jgi:hypothetical protein
MFEGGDFPLIHTVNDTLPNLGNTATPAVAHTKLGLAFLGELAKNGTSGGGGNVLSNGVAVPGVSATAGYSLDDSMNVAAGASSLSFVLSPGSGNADLYVRFGSAPTDSLYDCRPYRLGSSETCSFATPQAGTWYVRIKARNNFNNVKLTPSYSTGGGGGGGTQTYTNSTAVAIPDNGVADSLITVTGRTGKAPAGSQVSGNITHPKRGDVRIRLFAPDGSTYLLKQSSTTDTAANVIATYTVNLSTEDLNGTWKLRVIDAAAGNVGTLNSWSLNF